jgi:pantoate--beta-alanine ligase
MTTVVEAPDRIRERVYDARSRGEKVGFVPTMGAYHRGHRALMAESVADNDVTVVSLFVNPRQFESNRQAREYPGDFEEDLRVLEAESVDLVFHPEPQEMYPDRDATDVLVQNDVTDRYEGAIKPRFFPGVARVVSKLLNLVPAHRVYFGEKDLQQLLMVRRMIRDLHFPHEMRTVPVVRDEHGVAYSSRNRRLGDEDWETVRQFRAVMREVKEQVPDRDDLDNYRQRLEDDGIELDYLDAVHYPTFETTEPENDQAVLIAAGTVGDVRIKDNLPLHAETLGELEEEVSRARAVR